jgi:phosphatidylglycerol:prolipoprotein diacylglycerol transferase
MPRARNKRSGQRGGTAASRGSTAAGRGSTRANRSGTASGGTKPQARTDAATSAPVDGAGNGNGSKDLPPGLSRVRDLPAGLAQGAAPTRSTGTAPRKGTLPTNVTVPSGSSPPARSRGAGPAGKTAKGKPAAQPAGTAQDAGQQDAGQQDDLPAWAVKAAEKLLTVSCWIDGGEEGDPFSATIRFSGRRDGVTGKPQPGDTFTQEETVDGILPGSGPMAITTEVRGINPGEWTATARPVTRPAGNAFRTYPPPGEEAESRQRVPPPRRVAIPAGPDATMHTANLLFAKVPGIFRPAYASLISLGTLVGLVLEALLLITHHYDAVRPLLFSLAAVAAGALGGKLWYIAVQRGRQRDGFCIQGFIAGAAVVVVAVALAGAGIPAGVYLSVTAAAVLIGIAIGRPGCFWAGCCTGRPTVSRWGIWSSDRRLGCRRLPAQLLEALASLVIGGAVLAVILTLGLARSGPVAVAGLTAYTLARQFIVGLRAEPPQHWRYGRQVTTAVAAIALIASVVLLAHPV